MEILGLFSVPWWLMGIVVFILTVCIYTWYQQSYFKRMGIRTKDTTFFLGDLTLMRTKGFNYIDLDLVKKYGKVFGCFMGNIPSLVISDTEMIKQITVKEFSKFTDRTNFIELKDRWYSAVSVATGDHWRYLRSTLSPTFTTGRMKAMTPYIKKCTDTLHTLLDEKIQECPEGFDVVPFIRGYTMDVICSTGFGLEVSAQTSPDNPFIKHSKEFLEFNGFTNPLFMLQVFFPIVPKLLPGLLATNFVSDKSFNFYLDATKKAFRERKQEQSPHRDLLQLMINAHKGDDLEDTTETDKKLSVEERKERGLTDDEVLINSIIFMIAGYDTTASAISWVLYDLVTQPGIQDKLVEEIEREIGQAEPSYDNAFKMQYLDMVVNETLRFHPIVGRINRMALEDVEINGVLIKRGTDCVFAPTALHFMPEYWEEPEKYDPERFAPENKHSHDEYAFMTFGQGPRNCIGKRLALLEVKMTVVSLLQRYKFYKTDQLAEPMPFVKNSLARPAKPVVLRVEKRQK